jgi:hypothetical protein
VGAIAAESRLVFSSGTGRASALLLDFDLGLQGFTRIEMACVLLLDLMGGWAWGIDLG